MSLLTGCGNSEGTNHTSITYYEYSAKDIRYYTKENEKICNLQISKTKRNFYKAFDGYCAVALANIGDYFGPVLVAEDEAQVCYKTDYTNEIVSSAGSIEVNGKTYFYSRDVNFLEGKLDGSKDYGNYFSKFTTLPEVARDIASQAEFSPIPASAKVEYKYSEGSDGTLTIKAAPYFSLKENVDIPSEINGKKVTAISSSAFEGFTNLKEVRFPSGLKSIGKYAFYGCSKLNRVYIPSTVTKIETGAFYKCSSDLYVFCGVATAPSGYYTSSNYGNWYDGVKQRVFNTNYYGENENYLFAQLKDETLLLAKYKGGESNLSIPSQINDINVTVIDQYCFSGNENLRTLSLPNTLIQIRNSAFENCINIRDIKIPFGTISIGKYAFYGCSKLSRVYIPSTVTTIDADAFYKCSSDLYVFCGVATAPSGYYTSSNYGTWYDGVKQKIFGVKDYGENNDYLYSELLDGTLIISDYLGNDENLVIPSEIEGKVISKIDSNCFNGKEFIRSIVIPDTIKTIGEYAFKGCVLIKELRLPYGLDTVEKYAFIGCAQLKRVFIPFSVKTIGAGAFSNCSKDLYIFCGVSENGIPSGYYTSYNYGNWYDGSKGRLFHSVGWLDYEDCLYNIDSSARDSNALNLILVAYKLDQNGILSLPQNGYLYINQMNYYIDSLGVALKGDKQVYSLNMPYTVTKLPNNCFDGCTNLEFTIDLNQTRIWWIGDYAFRNTKLHEMRLPKEMKNLGEGAFSGTTFTTLYYDGSMEDWNSANKSDAGIIEFILHQSWKKGSAISKVQCADGVISV